VQARRKLFGNANKEHVKWQSSKAIPEERATKIKLQFSNASRQM
jgi:hypothetical protein